MSSRMRRVQNANMERRPEVFSADIQMFLTYIKWLQTCHPVYYPVNKEAKMIFYTVECRVCPAQKEHIRWRWRLWTVWEKVVTYETHLLFLHLRYRLKNYKHTPTAGTFVPSQVTIAVRSLVIVTQTDWVMSQHHRCCEWEWLSKIQRRFHTGSLHFHQTEHRVI